MNWTRSRRVTRYQELEDFVRTNSNQLARTAYALTWDKGKAEDLVQETFLRLARHWDRVRSMERPVAYARRVLVNLLLDNAGKSAAQHHELVGDAELQSHADSSVGRLLAAVEDMAELKAAMLQLSSRQQAVLTLRYLDDLSQGEVAEVLGCSASTVSSTASRAAARLAKALEAGRRSQPSSPPASPGLSSLEAAPSTSCRKETTKC